MHDHHHHHEHRQFNKKRLVWAIVITFITLILEIAGGIYSGSLALLSDAVHMFSHLFSLGISYIAIILALKPATSTHTFGFYRSEILAAFINGFTLFIIVGAILYGAYERFQNPTAIKADFMLIVAAIGLVVNVATAMLLHSGSKEDINIKGAFLHSLGDMISSVGVVGAAVAIYYTGWYMLDTFISVLIALVICYWAIRLTLDSAHILLEGVPKEIDLNEVESTIKDIIAKPTSIHHTHAWQISTNIYAFTAHVTVDECVEQNETTRYTNEIQRALADRFHIHHTTIQFETRVCDM